MKKDGAIEYANSFWLALAHLLFYISAITEWFISKSSTGRLINTRNGAIFHEFDGPRRSHLHFGVADLMPS
ncbi:hypothetical protein ACPOL_2613 [Acidisarcina polymorpha]|uniref:Uncharacterized protein n=1 Tax=Acidisarcina polymorpha TaxID=2211140 RepID=A0A2Z5FYH9_9BACT|nr:hypothetical protein ACPOL_2613 [Acidisarcina polymorpha]